MKSTNRCAISIACLIALTCLLLPCASVAAPSARWLLVVDTSLSMRSRAKNTEMVVRELLGSGMHGQMAGGDTLGVWTFNNQLHSGEVPLQVWSPEEARLIAERTTQFIATRHYEKSTDIETMLKEMFGVVQASEVITVIIISDADDPIKGTPFDAKINEVYKKHYREEKKLNMPFVTVLRGEKGVLTTNTVNLAQWPVEIPAIKREIPKPPQPKPAPKPVATLPPLIISGKKPEPAVTPAPSMVTPTPAVSPQPTQTIQNIVAPPVTPPPQPTSVPAPTPSKSNTAPALEPHADATPPKPVVVAPPQLAPSAPKTEPVQQSVASVEKTNIAPKAPAAETAVAVAPRSFFAQSYVWIILMIVATVVIGAVFVILRRSRASHTSLITSSLDRDKH